MTTSGTGTARDGAARGSGNASLDEVPDVATLGDVVPVETLRAELPGGWTARLTLVQFGPEPLEEALVFSRPRGDRRLLLKPVTLTEPSGAVEWYVGRHPTTGREHVRTVDTLSDALRAAVNWTHQQRDWG